MGRKLAFIEQQLRTWFKLTLSSPAVWVLFHRGHINGNTGAQTVKRLTCSHIAVTLGRSERKVLAFTTVMDSWKGYI